MTVDEIRLPIAQLLGRVYTVTINYETRFRPKDNGKELDLPTNVVLLDYVVHRAFIAVFSSRPSLFYAQ